MRILFLCLLGLILTGCRDNSPLLDQIKKNGELVVITRNSPTTYYRGPLGPTGFEYDLAKLFADELGVELKIIIPDSFGDIIPMIRSGKAHFAAAGLTVTEQRKKLVRFGPTYQQITQQIVYHRHENKPANIGDVSNGILEIVAGSSHAERLKELQHDHPELTWIENNELESEELLQLVKDQLIQYTIADSNEVALGKRFFPQLRVGLDITKPQSLAWAFSYRHDFSLYDTALVFFDKIKKNGKLDHLIDRYYGNIDNFSHASRRMFFCYFKQRLPLYQKTFEQAAQANNLDWRLLASIGYQESIWDPQAVSPTGVRGIMMLTRRTAKQLGVKQRTNPTQSILGGARYFAKMKHIIPAHIQEPDRTWFALAAYNVGFGHLEDARKITEKLGANPDQWLYVKKSLPLLKKKKWFQQTRYGYARGDEPVAYVERIRTFYELLVWITEQDVPTNGTALKALTIDPIVL